MSKYTAGPWVHSSKLCSLVGSNGNQVRFYGPITIAMSEPTEEERANYRLIVSAPEMAEMLNGKILAALTQPQMFDLEGLRSDVEAILKIAGVTE